jgi:hypothetical protein
MGKTPLKVQCMKKEEEKTVAKQLSPSPQDDHVEGGT